jgi:heterodisulfide reductase subunit B
LLGIALPARNLALAEEQGYDSMFVPCAACFSRLATTRHELAHDEKLAEMMPGIIERPLGNTVEILNVIQLLLRYTEKIRERAEAGSSSVPLGQLKVAAYYGCLLVRPVEVAAADDVEMPTTMEQVISACGATPVKWNMAVECCGGSLSVSRTSSVVRLGRRIIDDARKSGADAIIVGCPMCHSNLDFRQAGWAEFGTAVPVLYLTQLVGLALGIDPGVLGMNRHFVDNRPLLGELAKRARQQVVKPKAAAKPETPAGEEAVV